MSLNITKMMLPIVFASCVLFAGCGSPSNQTPANQADIKNDVNQALQAPVQTAQEANAQAPS